MPQLLDTGLFSIVDTDSSIGVGWKLNFYTTGTSTRKNTYPTRADAVALTNANANPVVLPADGRIAAIWLLDDANYKCVLADENDVVKETVDPVAEALGGTGGADMIGIAHGGTVQDAVDGWVTVKQFGAVGDNVADDLISINNAAAKARELGWGLRFNQTLSGYRVSSTVDLSNIAFIDMRGGRVRGAWSGIPAMTIGNTTGVLVAGEMWLEAVRDSHSIVDGTYGVNMLGLRSCDIHAEIEGFDVALYAAGASGVNRSWFGNRFWIQRSYECGSMMYVDLSDPPSGDNYFNFNEISGGSHFLGNVAKKAGRATIKLRISGARTQAIDNLVHVDVGIDGGGHHTDSALLMYWDNSASVYSHGFDFTGTRVETYGTFAADPKLVYGAVNTNLASRVEVTGQITSITHARWTLEIGELNNNSVVLDTKTRWTLNNNQGKVAPQFPDPEFWQVNGSVYVSNRIMWDTIFTAPALAITNNVAARTTRALGDGKLISNSSTVGYGLRWKKTAGTPVMLRLPKGITFVVICYDASRNILSGTAPHYAVGTNSRAFTIGGAALYQASSSWLYLHPDVVWFDLIVCSWTSAARSLEDLQRFQVILGDDVTRDTSTLPQNAVAANIPLLMPPNKFASSATIQSFYGLGADLAGTTNNGYRNAFDLRTTLTVAAVATDTTVTLASVAGITSGDTIGVELDTALTGDDRQWHITTVNGAPVGSVVTLTVAMPVAAAIGREARCNRWTAK